MAKVYTMGELERARKKAQIREWVQDKKDKATNWCYAHKNEILTYGKTIRSYFFFRRREKYSLLYGKK